MMRTALIIATALFAGCQSTRDPLQDVYWARTQDGWPALCVPGDQPRCITPAYEDRDHFVGGICGYRSSET